jgi:hypothetical protein
MENQLPPHLKGRKASEIFMEYVEPFLTTLLLDRVDKGVPEAPGIEELETILRVPWCIWNAIIAEKVPNNKIDFLTWMDSLIGHVPISIRELLDFMKNRKRNQFGQYQYYLGKYKFYYQNNELRVSVETTLPDISP